MLRKMLMAILCTTTNMETTIFKISLNKPDKITLYVDNQNNTYIEIYSNENMTNFWILNPGISEIGLPFKKGVCYYKLYQNAPYNVPYYIKFTSRH